MLKNPIVQIPFLSEGTICPPAEKYFRRFFYDPVGDGNKTRLVFPLYHDEIIVY